MPAIQKKTTLSGVRRQQPRHVEPEGCGEGREPDEPERGEDVAHLVEGRDADLAAVPLVQALGGEQDQGERHRDGDPAHGREGVLRILRGDGDESGDEEGRDIARHEHANDLPVPTSRHDGRHRDGTGDGLDRRGCPATIERGHVSPSPRPGNPGPFTRVAVRFCTGCACLDCSPARLHVHRPLEADLLTVVEKGRLGNGHLNADITRTWIEDLEGIRGA